MVPVKSLVHQQIIECTGGSGKGVGTVVGS